MCDCLQHGYGPYSWDAAGEANDMLVDALARIHERLRPYGDNQAIERECLALLADVHERLPEVVWLRAVPENLTLQ